MNDNQRTKAVGLIVFGLTVVVFAILYPFGETETMRLPDTITGHPLRIEAYGLDAVENITQLHGKDFALTDGAVGVYGQTGEATLWVSVSASKADAAELVIDMRDKIFEGNSPFEAVGEESMGGRMVYELVGFGQAHFYFQSGGQVIWVAVEQIVADKVLAELLVFYP